MAGDKMSKAVRQVFLSLSLGLGNFRSDCRHLRVLLYLASGLHSYAR